MEGSLVIRSDPSDIRGIVTLFESVYGGSYPAPELRSASALRSHLASRGETYFCAVLAGVVVGCVSARILSITRCPTTGEHVSEIGKLCTNPELGNRGALAKLLASAAIEASAQAGARAWYATVRSGPSLRIARALGFAAVGFTEEHLVGAIREPHVVMLRSTKRQLDSRVEPLERSVVGSVYDTPLVRSVTRALALERTVTGVYPITECVVEPDVPLHSVHVQRFDNERHVRYASLPPWANMYADVVVPCDKAERIRELRHSGWRLSAFLPAWYQLKFDCVVLSATGSQPAEPRDRIIREALQQFEDFSPSHRAMREEQRHV